MNDRHHEKGCSHAEARSVRAAVVGGLPTQLAVTRRHRRRDAGRGRDPGDDGLHLDRADPRGHRPVHGHLSHLGVRAPRLLPAAGGRCRLRDRRHPCRRARRARHRRTPAELRRMAGLDQPGRAGLRRAAGPGAAAQARLPRRLPQRIRPGRVPHRRRHPGLRRSDSRHARDSQGLGQLVRAAVVDDHPRRRRQPVDGRVRGRRPGHHPGVQAVPSHGAWRRRRRDPVDHRVEHAERRRRTASRSSGLSRAASRRSGCRRGSPGATSRRSSASRSPASC